MKLPLFSTVSLSTLILFGAAGTHSFSQQAPASPGQADQYPQSAPPAQATRVEARSSRAFEGTIQKAGPTFVLQDSATHCYQVDDQDAAEQHEGQVVKVIGIFDSRTNTLHVVDIVPQSGAK